MISQQYKEATVKLIKWEIQTYENKIQQQPKAARCNQKNLCVALNKSHQDEVALSHEST